MKGKAYRATENIFSSRITALYTGIEVGSIFILTSIVHPKSIVPNNHK